MFAQGDIIEVNFDPTIGHEPAKRRPALVVSTENFNMRSSLTFLAPITSVDNGYPLHVRLDESCGVRGFVCVEQIRSMDVTARHAQKIAEISVADMNQVLNYIAPVFGI